MDIWIDTESGTWGQVPSLRIIKDFDDGPSLLDEMGDADIIAYGFEHGKTAESKAALMGRIDQAFHTARVRVADEEPPNETQVVMTEGVLIGLDIGQSLVREALGEE